MNYLKSLTIFLKYKLRSFVVQNPSLYFGMIKLFKKNIIDQIVDKSTDIVIDGFGGCGNTFALHAFNFAQKKRYKITHHLHVPAPIIKASKLNIPTIVLIRKPMDALVSIMSRGHRDSSDFSINYFLKDYILFYKTIMPFSNDFIIADFDDLINRFGDVINSVNINYGTNFNVFGGSNEDIRSCLNNITLGKPGTYRKVDKKLLQQRIQSKKYSKLLKQANSVFQEFCDLKIKTKL